MVLGRIGQACHGRLSRPTKSRAIKTIVHNHWRGKNDIVMKLRLTFSGRAQQENVVGKFFLRMRGKSQFVLCFACPGSTTSWGRK